MVDRTELIDDLQEIALAMEEGSYMQSPEIIRLAIEALKFDAAVQAERDALNLAAWKFTDTWINTEVDSFDEEYEGEMEKLNDLANAVMLLCKPPTPIDTALTTQETVLPKE